MIRALWSPADSDDIARRTRTSPTRSRVLAQGGILGLFLAISAATARDMLPHAAGKPVALYVDWPQVAAGSQTAGRPGRRHACLRVTVVRSDSAGMTPVPMTPGHGGYPSPEAVLQDSVNGIRLRFLSTLTWT